MAKYSQKPRRPSINWGNPITEGIILDAPIFEGSGPTVRDFGPYKIDGTKQGTSTWTSDRKMRFSNATNDYISFGTTVPTLISDRGTVIIKRRKTDATARNSVVFGTDSTASATRIFHSYCPFSDGTVYFDVGGTSEGTTRLSIAGLSFSDDLFIFSFGALYGMNIWLNGKRVAHNTATPTRNTTAVNFQINRQTPTFFGDLIDVDYIRVYNRELHASEILDTFENPFRIYKRPKQFFFNSVSAGGTFVAGALTKYSEQEALNSIKGSSEHQYTEQEIANIYAGNALHSKTFQEVLNGYAGIAPHAKSEQEQLYANIAVNLGFSGGEKQFSTQELLNMAKNSSLTLENVIAGTGFSATYTSQYPPAQNSTYVIATSSVVSPDYDPYNATNPLSTKTGAWINNVWAGGTNVTLRMNIDLGSAKTIVRIYYENGHDSGTNTDAGLKTFTFWGSNTAGAFADTTYATDTNWTAITTSQATFDQHTGSDIADPKYITATNAVAYRYYSIKVADTWGGGGGYPYMAIRRIELQTLG